MSVDGRLSALRSLEGTPMYRRFSESRGSSMPHHGMQYPTPCEVGHSTSTIPYNHPFFSRFSNPSCQSRVPKYLDFLRPCRPPSWRSWGSIPPATYVLSSKPIAQTNLRRNWNLRLSAPRYRCQMRC